MGKEVSFRLCLLEKVENIEESEREVGWDGLNLCPSFLVENRDWKMILANLNSVEGEAKMSHILSKL